MYKFVWEGGGSKWKLAPLWKRKVFKTKIEEENKKDPKGNARYNNKQCQGSSHWRWNWQNNIKKVWMYYRKKRGKYLKDIFFQKAYQKLYGLYQKVVHRTIHYYFFSAK